jgi:hypothetical protein
MKASINGRNKERKNGLLDRYTDKKAGKHTDRQIGR